MLPGVRGQCVEKTAKHHEVQQDAKREQGHAVDVQAPALPALAVQQAQNHAKQHHHFAGPGVHCAHTQPPCNGHGQRNTAHQGAAKQGRHAQHDGAAVEIDPRHNDHRAQHAQNAKAAKQQPRCHLAGQTPQPPCPHKAAVHKTKRQHQCQRFDDFYEHGVRAEHMAMHADRILPVASKASILFTT